MTVETNKAEETLQFAKKMAEGAKAGEVYCLTGTLGAGKTVFAKGFAKGLNIKDDVTSPTFTLMNEYSGRLMLYHFDLYRIEEIDEMYELGFEEFFNGSGVCLIEWPQIAESLIPQNATWITIENHQQDVDKRKITVRNKNDTINRQFGQRCQHSGND